MSSKTGIRQLPDFLAEKIGSSELLRQPLDQFRYMTSPGRLSRAFGSKPQEKSLSGSAISDFYKAEIYYPYQIASLKKGSEKNRDGISYSILKLPNEDHIPFSWITPLQQAMKEEHVNFGEWEAFQDVLLAAEPESFSPERCWMREHFPETPEGLHQAFLDSPEGDAALAKFSEAFKLFAERSGVRLNISQAQALPQPDQTPE